MFGLLTALLTTLGATGLGAILKMVTGVVDSIAAGKEAAYKRELARDLQNSNIELAHIQAIFGTDAESQRYARQTRRVLAIMGMCVFAVIAIVCTLFPHAEIVTYRLPEHQQQFSLFWGVLRVPVGGSDPTVTVSTGHLSIMAFTQLGLIFGFYFTPGGRK